MGRLVARGEVENFKSGTLKSVAQIDSEISYLAEETLIAEEALKEAMGYLSSLFGIEYKVEKAPEVKAPIIEKSTPKKGQSTEIKSKDSPYESVLFTSKETYETYIEIINLIEEPYVNERLAPINERVNKINENNPLAKTFLTGLLDLYKKSAKPTKALKAAQELLDEGYIEGKLIQGIYSNRYDRDSIDPKDLYELFSIPSKYGLKPANYYLGRLEMEGYGKSKPQYSSAEKHFKQAGMMNAGGRFLLGYLSWNLYPTLEIDEKKAKNFFSEASYLGSSEASFYLGEIHYRGEGKEDIDKEKGLKHLREAMKFGSLKARAYLDYLDISNSKNEAAAFNDLLTLADNISLPYALGKVALCYYKGIGTLANITKARSYANKGAKLGDPLSTFLKGEFARKGLGQQENLKTAIKHYKEAYLLGGEEGSLAYANALYFGHGLSIDYEGARKIYSYLYSRYLNPKATSMLGDIYYYHGDDGEDLKTAFSFHRYAGETLGVRMSNERLAEMYLLGKGTDVDDVKALKEAEIAYNSGRKSAGYVYGIAYLRNHPEDTNPGISAIIEAAKAGHPAAGAYCLKYKLKF